MGQIKNVYSIANFNKRVNFNLKEYEEFASRVTVFSTSREHEEQPSPQHSVPQSDRELAPTRSPLLWLAAPPLAGPLSPCDTACHRRAERPSRSTPQTERRRFGCGLVGFCCSVRRASSRREGGTLVLNSRRYSGRYSSRRCNTSGDKTLAHGPDSQPPPVQLADRHWPSRISPLIAKEYKQN